MKIALEGAVWTVAEPLDADRAGFGSVFHASSEKFPNAVAKFVPKDAGAERELLMGDSLRAAEYRNVIPILDKGEHEDQWVLIMPRAKFSLAQYLVGRVRLEVDEILSILGDVSLAMADMGGSIVHRDLKPQNILYLDDRWCVADFGIARYTEATTAADTRKLNLSRPYAAPEQWRFERATSATDVYSFGVMAYRLLANELPFPGPDFREQHLHDPAPALEAGNAQLRMLIQECLYKEPSARPLAQDLPLRLERAAAQTVTATFSKLNRVSEEDIRTRAVQQAQASEEKQRIEFVSGMLIAGSQSFEAIVSSVINALEANAPTARLTRTDGGLTQGFQAELRDAAISVGFPIEAGAWDGPFTVIASSFIEVTLKRSAKSDWVGRSHSLWYCDAAVEGRFAWYELGFASNPLTTKYTAMSPYSSHPRGTEDAFRPGVMPTILGWPVEELDRADLGSFVARWAEWFAEAALGELNRPPGLSEESRTTGWRLT